MCIRDSNDSDHTENGMSHVINEVAHGRSAITQNEKREAEENGEQQNLKHVTLGESADDAVRNLSLIHI